ncbi:MAG: aminotransferase class V-fold PLP-dependent enzyme [Bacteroidota bacterium]
MKKFETKAIRTQAERSHNREHSVPAYFTSSFMFDDAEHMRAMFSGEAEGNIYSRYSNPNTDELVEKVCQMEGAEAGFTTASGMSAVFNSIVPFVKAGDHVIASRAVFGSTHQILTQILPRWNITFTYVEPDDVNSWEAAVQPNTKLLMIETPSNPGLTLIDLEAAGVFAKKHNLIYCVDNCFATPYLQQPIQYGADIVSHSGTKWMDGQGRVLGGIIVGRADLMQEVQLFIRHSGPAMSPFNAWILSKSLETLAVRMDRHCSNAKKVARFFDEFDEVNRVLYPHLPAHPQYRLARKQMKLGGGIVTFEVKGGYHRAKAFINEIKMISLSSNLGDARSIVTHPASTTHSKLTEAEQLSVGLTPGLIRLSVGLEHIEDIIGDLKQALEKTKSLATPIASV